MSSFILSKTDSNSKPSSHLVDENSIRQSTHKLFLHDNLNDSSSPGDDDDVRSPPQSFKNDHAKFTSNSNLFPYIFKRRFFLRRRIIIGMDNA